LGIGQICRITCQDHSPRLYPDRQVHYPTTTFQTGSKALREPPAKLVTPEEAEPYWLIFPPLQRPNGIAMASPLNLFVIQASSGRTWRPMNSKHSAFGGLF
jgi:hypothetical protein